MNRLRWVILPVILGSALMSLPDVRQASAAEEAQTTKLEASSFPMMDEEGDEVPGKFWIMVTLTTEDGRYVGNRTLSIVEPIDFFGRREAILGTAVTDGTGVATVTYQPSDASEHTVVVRFSGDKEYAASKAELVIDVAEAISPFPEEDTPLASVGTGLAVFLGFLGVAFWAVLLGVLSRTAWRIKRAARAEPVLAPPVTWSQ
jgi:hypothetical protein